jgi:DnaJ-class molecular chaperone
MSKHTTFVRVQGNESMSYYETTYICDYCNGEGYLYWIDKNEEAKREDCKECNGKGRWTERC